MKTSNLRTLKIMPRNLKEIVVHDFGFCSIGSVDFNTDQNVAIYVFGLLVKLCMALYKLHDDCVQVM